MMFAVAMLAVLVAMALALARGFLGPTVYDRILAVNSTGTKIVLMIALYEFMLGQHDVLLDIALVYALINFIATIAVLRFFAYDVKAPGDPHHAATTAATPIAEEKPQ